MKIIYTISFIAFFLISLTLNSQNQELWGMTTYGGEHDKGTIFKTDLNGENQSVQHSFYNNVGGGAKYLKLCEAINGNLYGMTQYGGEFDSGVLFEYNPSTESYRTIISFNASTTIGGIPFGSLVEASNNKLYGMVNEGGSNGAGYIFEFDPSSESLTNVMDFDYSAKGGYPLGSLIETGTNILYGMATSGGANGSGCLFEFNYQTGVFTKKVDFDGAAKGAYPFGSLMKASNNKLYGMTTEGGINDEGVLFEFDLGSDTYSKVFDFDGVNGWYPYGDLVEYSNGKLYGMTELGGVNNRGVLFEFELSTNNFTKKIDFGGAITSEQPKGTLMIASNGYLYGFSSQGGVNYNGTLFEYNVNTNNLVVKFEFDDFNGDSPFGTLVQATNGKLYGVTSAGGASGGGVLLEYNTTNSTFVKKVDIGNAPNGSNPEGNLLEASNNKLYGMTNSGGKYWNGVIFEYDLGNNTYSKVFDFEKGVSGANPLGSLIEFPNGKLYGVTSAGGADGYGVLFEFDYNTNTYTKKIDFGGTTGLRFPTHHLVKASNGKLYGISSNTNNYSSLFEYDITTNSISRIDFSPPPSGGVSPNTVVQLPNGKLYGLAYTGSGNYGGIYEYDISNDNLVILHDFNQTDGFAVNGGGLILGSNGNLYGVTGAGGTNNLGAFFEYNLTSNIYTKKFDFLSAMGSQPRGNICESSPGKFYGMTLEGGNNNGGVIYEYDISSSYDVKEYFNGSNGESPAYNGLIKIDNATTSVNEINGLINYVYPNPATGLFMLSLRGDETVKYSVATIEGRIVLEGNSNENIVRIDLTNESNGVYFLKVNQGKVNETIKLIKN